MDDDGRIEDLRQRLGQAGWALGEPESDAATPFWRAGASPIHSDAIGSGYRGGGRSRRAAVEDVYAQILGQLPWFVVNDEPECVTDPDRKGGESWRWTLERQVGELTVRVTVDIAGGLSVDCPNPRIAEAVQSLGRSEIDRLVDAKTPPRRVIVSSEGVGTLLS